MKWLSIILLMACSTPENRKDFLAPWVGLSVTALQEHDFFSEVDYEATEIDNNSEVRDFWQREPIPSPARCAVLNGCMGYPTPIDCHYIFRIVDSKITEAKYQGVCRFQKYLLPNN